MHFTKTVTGNTWRPGIDDFFEHFSGTNAGLFVECGAELVVENFTGVWGQMQQPSRRDLMACLTA